jgi:hypothetical protein
MCFAVKRPLNAAKMLLCGYVVWKQSMAGATSRKIGSVGLTIGAPGNENPRHTCCTTGGFHVLQKTKLHASVPDPSISGTSHVGCNGQCFPAARDVTISMCMTSLPDYCGAKGNDCTATGHTPGVGTLTPRVLPRVLLSPP